MAAEVQISGRRIAVTGAGGFIGSHVCRRLAGEGDVLGLEVDPAREQAVAETGARFALCDVRDAAAVEAALEGVELVVHTAAHVREWGAMEEFIELNVRGTANVLDAAERHGAERVVHVSSVVVYGYDDPSSQDESAFLRNCGIPYIDTKSASDRLARERGAVVVRPGDVYGPASVPWLIRPVALSRAGQLAVPGAGDGRMLPVYIDDLVEAIVLALRKGRPGTAYTAWSDEDVSFAEFFERLAGIGGGSPPRRLPKPLLTLGAGVAERVAHLLGRPPMFGRAGVTFVDRRGKASTEKARAELGWEPKVMLDEGMRRSADWLAQAEAEVRPPAPPEQPAGAAR